MGRLETRRSVEHSNLLTLILLPGTLLKELVVIAWRVEDMLKFVNLDSSANGIDPLYAAIPLLKENLRIELAQFLFNGLKCILGEMRYTLE